MIPDASKDIPLTHCFRSADELNTERIEPIFAWTAFDESAGIPYTNFNDFLHYSPYPQANTVFNYNY